jgi:hypothetical protein
MKTLITLILPLLLVKVTYAQEEQGAVLPPANETPYSNVIQVDNTSKEELHKRARKWAAYNCELIVLDDSEEIVAHGIVFLNQWYQSDITYTVKVKVKESRYKYEITNLRVRSRYNDSGAIEYPLEDYTMIGKKKFDQVVKEELNHKLIVLLEQAMKTPIDDNW